VEEEEGACAKLKNIPSRYPQFPQMVETCAVFVAGMLISEI